jgi:hypothetical protein
VNRLARLIEELPPEDLALVLKDLESGTLARLARQRLDYLDRLAARRTCPTCGRELAPGEQKYAIEFGPVGLRQKAWFDELDCLDHFLDRRRATATTDTARTTCTAGTDGSGDDPLASVPADASGARPAVPRTRWPWSAGSRTPSHGPREGRA